MWTFTAYILWKLSKAKGSNRIEFPELTHFIFDVLWKEYKIVLNDSSKELEREIEYLKELGAVNYDGYEIEVKEKLGEIAQIVEQSSLKDQLTLYREYLSRINQAIDAKIKPKSITSS